MSSSHLFLGLPAGLLALRDVENNSKSSANRRFEKQSDCRTPRLMPMPFSRHRTKSSSTAAFRTVLNSKLLSGSHLLHAYLDLEHVALFVCQDCCFVVSILPLQLADVVWIRYRNERAVSNQCFVLYRVEGFREVHSPLSTF